MNGENEILDNDLKKGLKKLHVQMVALGGVIGSAYFYGLGGLMSMTGPASFLAFAFGGILVFSTLYCLGELLVAMPTTGSFISYSREFISDGFAAGVGWTYWVAIIVYIPSECIVTGTIMHMYFPQLSIFIWAIFFAILLTMINFGQVANLGKIESVLAMTKVIAIIIFTVLAILILFGVIGTQGAPGTKNLLQQGGLFPLGVLAVFLNMSIIVMNFAGIEIIALTAGETENPEKVMPSAVRAGAFRIFFLFVIPSFLIAMIYPWTLASYEESAFAAALAFNGFTALSHIFNLIIIVAAFSCANCNLYAAIRAMYSLSKEGMAPGKISYVTAKGVPVYSAGFSLILVWIILIIYSFDKSGLFYMYLLATSGVVTVFCWGSICISQYRFRKRLYAEGLLKSNLKFHTPFYPLPNILGLAILGFTLILTTISPDLRLSIYIGMPCFIVPYLIIEVLKKTGKFKMKKEINLTEVLDEIKSPDYLINK
ncbi:amino acid permease [Sinanaerobacter chloroacetimidivorans]|uniref:Amino acid permease n=1 Tax=Sinanaerobacter chloroacetimidivorans TaxID=2818044 RepID=A0A8J8B152_9FIRM|nr:amino acid permease [Sinanaerobacter chloroacetimidivorans]MBR0597296.1 amino acid permease [Sinanaerobacter chloroacetimidivorans]